MDDLPDEKTLIGYVRKAAELNDTGAKIPKQPRKPPQPIKVPHDLRLALGGNAKARKTFEEFSPSHRREYVDWIVSAKRDDTRQRRLTTAVQWLSEGKPHNWRYVK